jgi:hypothetical protein
MCTYNVGVLLSPSNYQMYVRSPHFENYGPSRVSFTGKFSPNFDLYKGFFMEKNGSNSQKFEIHPNCPIF